MCVAVPGQVVSISEGPGPSRPAQVVFGGGEARDVDLAMLPQVGVGDYVIVHSGFAIKTLTEQSAKESYDLFTRAGRLTGSGPHDPTESARLGSWSCP